MWPHACLFIWFQCLANYNLVHADMWKGNKPPPKMRLDESAITLRLEKYKIQIDYYLKNIHRKTTEIDEKMREEALDSKYVTYCLIAKKYYWYGDPIQSANYFYKDYLDQEDLLKLTTGAIPWDCGHSDGDSFGGALSLWEENHVYSEVAKHYPEFYARAMRSYKNFSDVALLKSNFAEYKKKWPDQAKNYQEMMRIWNKAKKLAKTEKPKPLEPAVQNHEWFYSDKQEEVLKALVYYSQNKVNFMLEKALKHKDSIIAAKAKEYLGKFIEADKK